MVFDNLRVSPFQQTRREHQTRDTSLRDKGIKRIELLVAIACYWVPVRFSEGSEFFSREHPKGSPRWCRTMLLPRYIGRDLFSPEDPRKINPPFMIIKPSTKAKVLFYKLLTKYNGSSTNEHKNKLPTTNENAIFITSGRCLQEASRSYQVFPCQSQNLCRVNLGHHGLKLQRSPCGCRRGEN